jgi:hypothetical protein
VLGAGVLVPFILTAGYLYRAGVFGRFWFWTVTYASDYVSMTPLSVGLENFEHQAGRMFHDFPLLLALAGVGLLAPLWDRASRAAARFTHPLALFSFLAICPGLYFRPHYFLLVLPALSLLAAVAVPALARLWPAGRLKPRASTVVSLIFMAAVIFPLAANATFFFKMSPEEVSRALYAPNPFPEAVTVSAYIRERSTPEDQIAVLGSEPEVYFYTDRRAATGYLYVYAMTEPHAFALTMQEEMKTQIEAARPRFLVLFGNPDFWPLPRMAFLVEWMGEYIPRHYRQVGTVDVRWPGPSIFAWGKDAPGLEPVSAFWIKVFERLPPAEAGPASESRPAPQS